LGEEADDVEVANAAVDRLLGMVGFRDGRGEVGLPMGWAIPHWSEPRGLDKLTRIE